MSKNIFNWGKISFSKFYLRFINECIQIFNLKTDQFLENLKIIADQKILVELSDMISELTLENISTV